MAYPFFTIGHSTRTVSQFVDLLQASQIELVVDVRHIPRSRTNPQFNRETLADDLATVQIGYAHVAALGGLRNRSSRLDISPNLFWDNLSFRNYADYAMTQEFHQGLTQLRDCGHDRCTAVMCAEAVWWRCHRRIIADYLILRRRRRIPHSSHKPYRSGATYPCRNSAARWHRHLSGTEVERFDRMITSVLARFRH